MKMKQHQKLSTAAAVLALIVTTITASAQKMTTPPEITTPDKVETSMCGSTVYYFRKSDPARTGVRVGAFADPTFPPPMGSGFEAYAHPWTKNISALPMPLGHHE